MSEPVPLIVGESHDVGGPGYTPEEWAELLERWRERLRTKIAAFEATHGSRESGALLRTRTGRQMDRRDVYRVVGRTARAAGITRPISPHALRRTVGTVGLTQGIPLREVQRLLRHARSDTTLRSYDLTGEQLERHASHQVAGFLAGFTP